MNYHNITKCDMKNGNGLRVVLWVSGCDHGCKNCHNKQTWNHCSGIKFDKDAYNELCEELKKDYHKGLTLSGGDPLSFKNRDFINDLLKNIKYEFPEKDVWCYTGFSWEDIKDLDCMKYIDFLVDGKYIEDLSIPSPKWCGSNNQKVIDVNETFRKNKIVIYK